MIEPLLIERKKSAILGECPRCNEKGEKSNLILFKGVSKETQKPYEFAKCESCGYTQHAHNNKLLPQQQCPQCSELLYKRVGKNGKHYWNCPECKIWILANEDFMPVTPPECKKHKQPMKHAYKKDDPNTFYWYCTAKGCSRITESDKYGKITREEYENPDVELDKEYSPEMDRL